MQTNKDKAFRCLHYHLGWVLIPLLPKGRKNTHCKIKETLLIRELKPTPNDMIETYETSSK